MYFYFAKSGDCSRTGTSLGSATLLFLPRLPIFPFLDQGEKRLKKILDLVPMSCAFLDFRKALDYVLRRFF